MTKVPTLMRAVLLTGHGGFDKLEYREDVPVPELQPGEVLIRVGAAGVNNTDINTRTGWYSKTVSEGTTAEGAQSGYGTKRVEDNAWTAAALAFPRIQGADACGQIVAVGRDVAPGRIGERVLIDPMLRSPLGYFGADCNGAFAEYTKVPAVQAIVIDSQLSDVELASFPCSYSTAENLLTRAHVNNRDTVLVTGASGGVGSAVVQIAKGRGATVIAVVGAEKADQVRSLGPDRIILRQDNFSEALGPESVDVVIDVVGGPEWPKLLEVLRTRGRYASSGAIAGPKVSLDLRTLYLKDLSLFGCTYFGPEIFHNLIVLIESGDVRPLVAKTFPLAEIVRAQTEFLAKRFVGKLVLVP
jgi:NADPH:quinone reductase-like Zn-dependent oxidoreductase